LRIDLDGTITPILRQRDESGALIPVVSPAGGPTRIADATDFIVRVATGHSGTVEILPGTPRSASAYTIIPLGADHPFLNSELAPSPGAYGSTSQSTTIHFHFAQRRLRWKTDNVAGHVDLDTGTPTVTIVLRLPRENNGEIILSLSPLPISDRSASALPAV
jgi:hypothetical protein